MDAELLKKIATAAVEAERDTKCPAQLMIAQCALESGWLKFAPGNNCFGIKVYDGCPDRQLLMTTEWFTDSELGWFLHSGDQRVASLKQPGTAARKDGRREYSVKDWFAAYPTLAGCFARRAEMFAQGRYLPFAQQFWADGDLEKLVRGIAPIYATDPHYAESVLAIANQNNVKAALAAAKENV